MNIQYATHIGFLNKETNLIVWNEIKKLEQESEKNTIKMNLSDLTLLNKNIEPLEMCFFLYDDDEKTRILYVYITEFNLKELYINVGNDKLILDITMSFSKQFIYNEKGTLLKYDFKFLPQIIECKNEKEKNVVYINYKEKYYNLNGKTHDFTKKNNNKDKFNLYYEKYHEKCCVGFISLSSHVEKIIFSSSNNSFKNFDKFIF